MTTLESKQLRLRQPLFHLIRPGSNLRIPYVLPYYYLAGDDDTIACCPKVTGGDVHFFSLADVFLTEQEARDEAAKITDAKKGA